MIKLQWQNERSREVAAAGAYEAVLISVSEVEDQVFGDPSKTETVLRWQFETTVARNSQGQSYLFSIKTKFSFGDFSAACTSKSCPKASKTGCTHSRSVCALLVLG